MSDAAISLEQVRFCWGGKDSFTLRCAAFEVPAGGRTLLLGASGSGKSTLLSLVCGIVSADSGVVRVAGTDLGGLKAGQRDRFRAEHIGVIFQQFNLLPFASVQDNLRLPLRFAPHRRSRVGNVRREAAALCTALRLPEGVLDARAGTLSVGQQQRVAAARALIGHPPLIVADEPTSALDKDTQQDFLNLLFDQLAQSNSALLMASHDESLGALFDRVVRLDDILEPVVTS